MSSPDQMEEDEVEEVEFMSETPLRPAWDCIDLLSGSEDEGCSSFTGLVEDEISRQKAHVTSTLDRLAHQVAREKKERADKCRAFKQKQILQKAHGQQELAFNSANGLNQEAKRCVDMWVKMPGLQPGVIAGFSGGRRRSVPFSRNTSTSHTCPVINCGRVYEHASLLQGHLKRFDHSPCDPTINLKGTPSVFFACVACGQHFPTKEAWRNHVETKVSSSNPDAHSTSQAYQRIVCFACPACYLLFSLRDECLQHMSAKNHFTEALAMNEPREEALPVPVPQYVKNRLIALCKDTGFSVRCSICHKVLISHQVAQAHFNVHCRQGCAVAKPEKTIVEVMKRLRVRGQCHACCKVFLSRAEIQSHEESTQHDVEINQTVEKALLQHHRFGEVARTQRARDELRSTGPQTPFQKRTRKKSDREHCSAKRPKLGTGKKTAMAWYCECGQSFSEESAASKHLLAVNQIFHQCGVCDKRMGESSITRLHMSRFHGGAHLSNFLFYCRKCRVEMPRHEDILLHVSETHNGHTYFTEQEVAEEVVAAIDAKPSTSNDFSPPSSSKSAAEPSPAEAGQTWMCRMCEDLFDSEAAVRQHCSDVDVHSFQRFICGHCPQKFFKESTVRRHCANEHDGQTKSSHYCGLCDSMPFESEAEFLEHYKILHGKDYYCMDDVVVVEPAVAEGASHFACLCMSSEKSKDKMKGTYTQCMRNLAADGKCLYVCPPCEVSAPSYARMKTHIHTKHAALHLDKTFEVECKVCPERFPGVPSFHEHYHSRHCTLEPCASSRTGKKQPATAKIPDAVEVKPDDIGKSVESENETRVPISEAEAEKETNEYDSGEEIKHILTVADEASENAEMEQALKRSLLEF